MSIQRYNRGRRATIIGLIVNAVLASIKLGAGILGHSQALIADAVESFADIFSSVAVWRGLAVAATPADEDHPYGHGKAEPIAAALVATMLLLAAAGIVITSLRDVFAPQQGPEAFTLAVLLAVVLVKELLFRFARREGAATESSAVLSDAWHHRSDAITSLAAAIGISVALIGGERYAAADDVAAIVAAGIIAWNGWRLLRPALDELMDTAPNLKLAEEIRGIASTVPGVCRVEKCLVRKMGYQYYVDMHVEVDPQLTVLSAHDIAHRVKDRVRMENPAVRDVLVHIEPAAGR
jgi:cation diffusion facilitator family transporter